MKDGITVDELIIQLGLDNRRKTVASLLAGNDTQCFTTQQYAERYHKLWHNNEEERREFWIKYLIDLTPKHMKSIDYVEVKPGVWAKRESQ